jgi:formylmethanofuran dehydrogenase subunit E-like metal-binding protein
MMRMRMMKTMFIHDHCVSRSEFFQSSQFLLSRFPHALDEKKLRLSSVVTMRERVFSALYDHSPGEKPAE